MGSPENPNIRFDEDGEPKPYTDAMYQNDIEFKSNQVNCPYRFLYKGYERRWAYYKVLVMFFKFLLCLPVVILSKQPVQQTIATLVLLTIMTIFAACTAPYTNPMSDKMEISGR